VNSLSIKNAAIKRWRNMSHLQDAALKFLKSSLIVGRCETVSILSLLHANSNYDQNSRCIPSWTQVHMTGIFRNQAGKRAVLTRAV
jgi:hypothetical protein